MVNWRHGLVLLTALWGQGAAGNDDPPAPTCGRGALVDAAFRDAALRTLQRLVVHAPGQPAHGAVRASLSPGHVDPQGAAWHYVSAYQVNLSLAEALRLAPALAPTAAEWLRWQARHITPTGERQGMVFDHWVRTGDLHVAPCPPGMALSACPQVDAYDSTAASLLLMADAYRGAVADPALLREPPVRAALQAAAGAVAALTHAPGLPWAKPGYPVSFLMDAVEVATGWHAWGRVQREVYGDGQAARASVAAARSVEEAVRTHLWDAPSGAWRVSLGAGAPVMGRWYPDAVAQIWPLLWGLGGARTEAPNQAAWRAAASHWLGQSHWAQRTVDPAGFWWPAAAVAARCVGDEAAARHWVARARAAWMRPDAPFAWPFHVGDLRWLLWMADPVPGGAGSGRVAFTPVP